MGRIGAVAASLSHPTRYATISRVQILIVALMLAAAVAFAIPAMHDSNLEKWLRGECELLAGGRVAHFRCSPQQLRYAPPVPGY